jgi:hypothetical protein
MVDKTGRAINKILNKFRDTGNIGHKTQGGQTVPDSIKTSAVLLIVKSFQSS